MARISTYAIDAVVTLLDKWIGTDSNSSNATKNFTAQSIADLFNDNGSIGIVNQNNFKFQTNLAGGRRQGTISLASGGGNNTAFSDLTSVRISINSLADTLALNYLLTLVDEPIMLAQVDDLNNFGVYKLDSLTQDVTETDFYNASITLVESNGSLFSEKTYGLITYPKAKDTWTVSDGSNSTAVASGETVTFSGTANEVEVAESSRTVTIGLPDDVTITNDLTVSGTGNFTGQVTIPILPSAQTDAASKDYVDNAVVGSLVYQGGYNASTNTPNLTTSPNSILKGWTYTVTLGGTFFGEVLEVGDVLIAEVNDPSALADWTTVQNNIDLASLTQVGIGNVNIDGAGNKDGLSLAYASGTATVGLNITDLPSLSVAITAADLAAIEIPLFNGDTSDANEKTSIAAILSVANSEISKTYTISDTATITYPFTLTNQNDVIIQLVDTVTNETVYADVDRISPTQATITFAATPTNSIRVLVQKIGK